MTVNGTSRSCLRPKSSAHGARAAREGIIAPSPRITIDAGRRIARPIREALMNGEPPARLPVSIVGLLTRMRRADRALRRELGRSPAFEEVAASLGLTASEQAEAIRALRSLAMRPSGGAAAGADEPVLVKVTCGRRSGDRPRAEGGRAS